MSNEIKIQENKKNKDANQELLAITDENFIMNETYNKFDSIIYNFDELNKFKDNILSLLKERDKIYLNKLFEYRTKTEKIKSDFDSTNKITNSKFSKIIDNQAKMTSRLDQLDNYESFVSKTNDKLISHEVRITNMREDFSLATQKYDKIYLDNLELPGYIGRCAKYKNCQQFFLDVIRDLAKLNKYREKNIIDLKMYKEKLETIISSMNSILDNNNESQIKYINETKEKILKDCNNMFESVCENMKEIRVENSKYAVDLISQSMDLSKKWDKIEKIREDLLEKFNYSVNKYQMLTDDTIKSFEEFKTEYSIIRRKFMELAEFIKDVRFRKNIGENVKKKEIKSMVKKIMKKRKSFDGKDVQLLSDISNIENIDYKKYYNVETKNDEEANNNNNDNRSNSLKLNQNKKEKKSNNGLYHNKNKKSTISKEKLHKRDLNQSAEETHAHRMNIKKSLNSSNNINHLHDEPSAKSINISPISIQDLKKNNINNSAVSSNRNINNINKKENNIDIKFRSEIASRQNGDKKNKNKEYIKEKIEKSQKIKEKNKAENDTGENSNKENIKMQNNEIKNSDNMNDVIEKDNITNLKEDIQNLKKIIQANNNLNIVERGFNSQKEDKIEKNNIKEILDKNINIQNNQPEYNINNEYNMQNPNIEYNINNENNIKIIDQNNSINQINGDKNEISTQCYDINLGRNDDASQISLSKIMTYRSNLEIKPSSNDDSSSISDGYNISSAKNYKNNNYGLNSEKSLSFISDNNNNNINKFLINDIHIVNNDRIIKELASELEQSTAKKDKLASNKKEIEQKFKQACSNIEPINLLSKKEDNINTKISSNTNEIKNDNPILRNNDMNIKGIISNSNTNTINNNQFEEQNVSNKKDNNIIINNKENQEQIINNNKLESNTINHDNENKEQILANNKNENINNEHDKGNQEYGINNNNKLIISNNELNDKNNESQKQINYINSINNNTNPNEIHPTKTTEEDNNDNISSGNYKNNNIMHQNPLTYENSNKNLNHANKNAINNLNPIKVNNEIYINDGINSNTINKKFHSVDQKLLNLELYTKEKILDLISQINQIKNSCKLPIDSSFIKEKSIIDTSKISYLQNKTSSNPKYKTFNNSFINNSNTNIIQQSPFYSEKNKENISANINEGNKNIYNINNNNNCNNSNPQYIFNNINIDKKRFSLKEINPKSSLLNHQMKKSNLCSINYSTSNNNSILNNLKQSNSLTENNNAVSRIINKNGNIKEIIDGNISNSKILQNINLNSDYNNKLIKDLDKKNENGNVIKNNYNNNDEIYNKSSNKSLNQGSNRNSFAYSNSTFKGTEIKLVDLNKLVNHQLPRNRLIPIHINDNDYLVSLNSK